VHTHLHRTQVQAPGLPGQHAVLQGELHGAQGGSPIRFRRLSSVRDGQGGALGEMVPERVQVQVHRDVI
jgi:hypothetical protein